MFFRRETIRVLGLLGALDPYRHKLNQGQIDSPVHSTSSLPNKETKSEDVALEVNTSEMLVNSSATTLEEFYPAVAVATLMRIIRDPTLAQHHSMVVQVSFFLFL